MKYYSNLFLSFYNLFLIIIFLVLSILFLYLVLKFYLEGIKINQNNYPVYLIAISSFINLIRILLNSSIIKVDVNGVKISKPLNPFFKTVFFEFEEISKVGIYYDPTQLNILLKKNVKEPKLISTYEVEYYEDVFQNYTCFEISSRSEDSLRKLNEVLEYYGVETTCSWHNSYNRTY